MNEKKIDKQRIFFEEFGDNLSKLSKMFDRSFVVENMNPK